MKCLIFVQSKNQKNFSKQPKKKFQNALKEIKRGAKNVRSLYCVVGDTYFTPNLVATTFQGE